MVFRECKRGVNEVDRTLIPLTRSRSGCENETFFLTFKPRKEVTYWTDN